MRLLLCMVLFVGSCSAQTFMYFGFTTSGSTDTYTTATSNDLINWTNTGGTYSGLAVNAPAVLYHNGQYFVFVSEANTSNYSTLYRWFVGKINTSTGAVTTVATIDWSSKIANLKLCYAGAPYVETDGVVHHFIPCAPTTGSGWDFHVYETHALNASLTSWSDPVDVNMSGTGYYDSRVWKVGSTYWMWCTCQGGTPCYMNGQPLTTGNWISLASSSSLTGPYTIVKDGSTDWAGFGNHKEGPWVVRYGDGWRLNFEDQQTMTMYYSDCNKMDFTACTWTSKTAWTEDRTYRNGTIIRTPLSPAAAIGVMQ